MKELHDERLNIPVLSVCNVVCDVQMIEVIRKESMVTALDPMRLDFILTAFRADLSYANSNAWLRCDPVCKWNRLGSLIPDICKRYPETVTERSRFRIYPEPLGTPLYSL
jgi:hypothetical protein